MAAAGHEGLHDAGESDVADGLAELVVGLGVVVLGRAQSQLLGGQVAYGAPVHGEVHGAGRRHHLYALLLELEEALGAYGLDLGHDDVGLVLTDDGLEGVAVEHVQHFALVGHLHGGRVVVAVAGNDVLPGPHGGDDKFLA